MQIIKTDNDFYTSVEKAFDEIDLKWRDYDGLLVLGSHMPTQVSEKITAIMDARENNRPFLGICFGMQLAAIEYARSVLKIKDATSEEIDKESEHQVINKLPRLRVGIDKVASWWGTTDESHWHNFAFNASYHAEFRKDWDISYTDGIAEVMRLRAHPFFVGVQFHPEYQSSKEKPHTLLLDFLNVCKK